MRRYETFIILDPDLSAEQRAPVIERVQEIMAQMGGFLVRIDEWDFHSYEHGHTHPNSDTVVHFDWNHYRYQHAHPDSDKHSTYTSTWTATSTIANTPTETGTPTFTFTPSATSAPTNTPTHSPTPACSSITAGGLQNPGRLDSATMDISNSSGGTISMLPCTLLE